jgi:hypothetical protein
MGTDSDEQTYVSGFEIPVCLRSGARATTACTIVQTYTRSSLNANPSPALWILKLLSFVTHVDVFGTQIRLGQRVDRYLS